MQSRTITSDLAARRDEAFAVLAALEGERIGLLSRAGNGDAEARRALLVLRPRLAKQAVLAADLDAAADIIAVDSPVGAGSGPGEAKLATLWAERLTIAREIERLVGAVAGQCRKMDAVRDACLDAGLIPGPVTAELHRFGDCLRLYIDSMLDFATGERGLAGHPSYRRLADVMLDGDTIMKLYRQASAARDESGAFAGP